uniref:Putative tail fiber protein n=1 Tax=viral metagenome TaxID=1070528 RepID=A0A6M3XMI7_9ZZZZ
MTVGRVENRISITGRETASRATDSAGKGLDKLDRKIDKTAASTSKLSRATKDAQQSLGRMGGLLKGAGWAAAAAGVAAAAKSAIDFAVAGEKAYNVTVVAQQSIRGYTAQMEAAAVATSGLVEGTDLEAFLTKLSKLGVDSGTQIKLLEGATKASLALNIEAEQAMSLLADVAKGRTSRLAELGVTIPASALAGKTAIEKLDIAVEHLSRTFEDINVDEFATDTQSALTDLANEWSDFQKATAAMRKQRRSLWDVVREDLDLVFAELETGTAIDKKIAGLFADATARAKALGVAEKMVADMAVITGNALAVESSGLEFVSEQLARADRVTRGVTDAQYAAAEAAKAQAKAMAEVNRLVDAGSRGTVEYTVALGHLIAMQSAAAAASAAAAYESTLAKGFEGSLGSWFKEEKKGGGGGGRKKTQRELLEEMFGSLPDQKNVEGISLDDELGGGSIRSQYGEDLVDDAAMFEDMERAIAGAAAQAKAAGLKEIFDAQAAAALNFASSFGEAAAQIGQHSEKMGSVLGAVSNAFAGFGAAQDEFGRMDSAIRGMGAIAAALIDDTAALAVVKVAEELAMAASSIASIGLSWKAAGHFAAAAAWGVAGALAGGKGKGSASAPSSSGGSVGATRAPSPSTGSGQGGYGNITINLNGGGIIGTAQEVAARTASQVAALRGTGMGRDHGGV